MSEKLKKIYERLGEINPVLFLNELVETSKQLGIYEAKLSDCRLENYIYLPFLQKKEAISSMRIEGTQTTISDIIENETTPDKNMESDLLEVFNHRKAIQSGGESLIKEDFTHDLIRFLHKTMLAGVKKKNSDINLGQYKNKNNFIVNSAKTIVFEPPHKEDTIDYMTDLLNFMNDKNIDINPLIKAALVHSQFESIHPFNDGNGRVGRLLITLYLYKQNSINVPLFYLSEVFEKEKGIYYKSLTESRKGNINNWIKYFLKSCITQAKKHIAYIDSINLLYSDTYTDIKQAINSSNVEELQDLIFSKPKINSSIVSEKLNISLTQAKRYLTCLENIGILTSDDRQRNTMYYFTELFDLISN